MNSPEKLTIQGAQDEEKQSKKTGRTEYRYYVEIVTDITTRNSEGKDTKN